MPAEAIDRAPDVRRDQAGDQQPDREAAHGEGDRPAALGRDQRHDQHRRVEDRAPGQNLGDAEHRHGAPGAVDEVAASGHGAAGANDDCRVTSSTPARLRLMRAGTERIVIAALAGGAVFGLGFGLVAAVLAPSGAAADIDHGAVAALHFRIHPAQDQYAAVEGNHFAVLRAAAVRHRRTDIGLAAGRAFQAQLVGVAWSARCIITPPVGPSVIT